jgi:cell division protein FtsI (penicillin-binding protein 3)
MGRRRSIRRRGPGLQRRRLAVVATLAALGYLALGGRALQLQALDSGWLSALYARQSARTLHLGALRGEIVDRNGQLLAVSANAESVAASPRRIRDRAEAARQLARRLGMRRAEVERLLSPSRSFVWIKRWVTPAEAASIRKANLQGVQLQAERKRYYPSRGLAASYLGFVGRDGEGLAGLELAFDAGLRGESSELPVKRDARGRRLPHWEGDMDARSGARVVLALDSKLQHYAEQALDRALARTQARRGVLVAIDPMTGDVLALAQRPPFNPNRFWLEDPARFRASAFVDGFEPGSTLKPFVVAAALEAQAVRATDRFDCENGAWTVADRTIRDHKPHGVLSVHDIVRVSSNIGAAKVAQRLGADSLLQGLRRFGFGSRPGSGFPGEAPGLIRPIRDSQAVERANYAFGQGLLVTPVQLAVAGAILANGGHRVVPRLALRVEGDDEVVAFPAEVGERVVSERTAGIVMRMLRDVVVSGSGTAAELPNHRVGGKTGTAQKAIGGRYSHDRYVASFLGIVPIERPRLVMVVVLDEPRGVRFGGVVAAPVFREVGAYAMEQLAVPRRGSG